jgi:beta-lactamase class A
MALERPIVPAPIRLGGYTFTDPLLSCNFSGAKIISEDQGMTSAIQRVIDEHKAAGDIEKASTYFTDLTTGSWSDTYENEKYYPSSLGKIPIMMAYYELADSSSTILGKQITYPIGSPDLNDAQQTKPEDAIVPGQTYSVEDLIGHMLKYSDNNAAELLYDNIDPDTIRNVYNDLGVPINDNPTLANMDFIIPQQIAMLFKVLYSGTFISHDFSEQALQLMSESSFTQGLVAGVPSSTVVSHKFGIVGITSGGVDMENELHDCGIVYAPNKPYLLCVMTRGGANLGDIENTIADISRTVYQREVSSK